MVDPRRVPMWYRTRAVPGFSDGTLDLVDGLAYYLAECLLRAVPGTRWEIDERSAAASLPIVAGLARPVSPVTLAIGLGRPVYKALKPDADPYPAPPPTRNDLQRAFDSGISS
jgi:hypothetical protein